MASLSRSSTEILDLGYSPLNGQRDINHRYALADHQKLPLSDEGTFVG